VQKCEKLCQELLEITGLEEGTETAHDKLQDKM